MNGTGFLAVPEPDAEAERMFEEDVEELGYVMNSTRVWAYQPGTGVGLFELMRHCVGRAELSNRERAIVVTAAASTYGDSYCSYAWGGRLAKEGGPELAAGVVRGTDDGLTPRERALTTWVRRVTRDPNATTAEDVEPLRAAGYTDAQIFAITTFVALRLAFATVNDALGIRPDAAYRRTTPGPVLDAVGYGRPIDDD